MLVEDLRRARRDRGWTRMTLADRAGVDGQAIKRLERGVGSMATVVAVMAALDYRLTGLAPGPTLGAQLRAARLRRSMSLEAAAGRARLSKTTIVALEHDGGSVASLLKLMTAIAPRVRRRAPERSYWGAGDKADRDSRFTPPEFMRGIYEAFGKIDLDPCAHHLSPVVAGRRIMRSEGGDGLTDEWSGKLAFVNPPYSEAKRWLARAHEQWRAGNVQTVVCLVPVRTDSAFFHDAICADADLYFLKGRVRFLDSQGGAQQTPFSLMLLTFGASAEQRLRYSALVVGTWFLPARPTTRAAKKD